jgi:hypothetical protein
MGLLMLCIFSATCQKETFYTGKGVVYINGRKEKIKTWLNVIDSTKSVSFFFDVVKDDIAWEHITTKYDLPFSVNINHTQVYYFKRVSDGDALCDIYYSDTTNANVAKSFIELTKIDTKKREIQGNFEFIFLKKRTCDVGSPDTLRVKCDGFCSTY